MKKIVYLLLFLTQVFWAQGVFEKGNEHYRKGNYQEAIQSYESILKGKKESCDLYYNLANAHYTNLLYFPPNGTLRGLSALEYFGKRLAF